MFVVGTTAGVWGIYALLVRVALSRHGQAILILSAPVLDTAFWQSPCAVEVKLAIANGFGKKKFAFSNIFP